MNSKYTLNIYAQQGLKTGFPENTYHTDTSRGCRNIIYNCTNWETGVKKIEIEINYPDERNVINTKKSNKCTCGVCGSELANIRGRHPGNDRREVCPTCLQERLEQIRDMLADDYGKACKQKE